MGQTTLSDDLRCSQTGWTTLRQAHSDDPDQARAAQHAILERYRPAVFRYLLAATRDPHTAEDLTQEFAYRFVRGDFKRADPARGRFRDYLRFSLANLVVDFQRRARRPRPLEMEPPASEGWPASASEPCEAGEPSEAAEGDPQFLQAWRHQLLSLAWQALRKREESTGQPVFTVLRRCAEHPKLKSPQVARELTLRLKKPVNANWVRKWLHLARQAFAELLVEEVARSTECDSTGDVEGELLALRLLNRYSRDALQLRRDSIFCACR